MRFLGKALVGLLALLGLIAIITVGGAWLMLRDLDVSGPAEKAVPDRFVLHLPLTQPLPEQAPPLSPFRLSQQDITLRDTMEAITRAADDPRVTALIATIGESGRSMAQTQDLRDAIARFRATGKPAVAFADTLGEAGSATTDYYLASAFDRVVLQPSGMLTLTGFAAEVPFARKALAAIGIDAEFGRRHEFKTAGDTLVRDDMSEAQRESLAVLLGDLQDQAIAGIARDRDLPEPEVRRLMTGLPLLAQGALSAGLVDGLDYWPETLAALNEETDTSDTLRLERYAALKDPRPPAATAPRIALIDAVGAIHRGKSDASPLGGPSIGGDTTAQAIRDALKDERVRAIVLRIDSPGGSYVASDTVWHEVRRARDRKIPVIASLSGVAASGGYFIAMGADHIIARPGSITGSIGVFAGKPVLAEMWDKLDITWERVAAGEHALMWSPNRAFTAAEQAWFDGMLDAIYQDFTAKAAKARGLSPEAIDAAARGRVFTGRQALDAGLVDALGGLPDALREAKERVSAPDAVVVSYPERKTRLEELMGLLGSGEFTRALALLGEVATLAEPLAAEAGRARISAQGPALLAPY